MVISVPIGYVDTLVYLKKTLLSPTEGSVPLSGLIF
jgi:hypothetical protein